MMILRVILCFLISISVVQAQDIIVSLKDGICHATFADETYSCSIGQHGITKNKREDDGKTPVGVFPLRRILVRPDKIYTDNLKYVSLPVNYITPDDGWCDDPKDPQYNTHINLAMFDPEISHETLFRDDDRYDVLIEVGYNDAPPKPDLGSAIFIHIADKKYAGTHGSIGFTEEDLMQILPQLNEDSKLIVKG